MHAVSVQYFASHSERVFRTRLYHMFPEISFPLRIMQIPFKGEGDLKKKIIKLLSYLLSREGMRGG